LYDLVNISVAEPHHFYAVPAPDPAPGKNFDAAPDPAAPAPTLPYYIARKNFCNELKFKLMFKLSSSYDFVATIFIAENMN
jgi:hypothetical protein